MYDTIAIIKGVHPGFVLDRELRKRKLKKGPFALSIGEYPQVLGDITKGKRKMNPSLALRIEEALGLEDGYLMILQALHEQQKAKDERNALLPKPDFSKIRRILFWDTNFDTIDWYKHKGGIIRRVFSRGNEQEKEELRRFYGDETIDPILIEYGI